ncbi:MAG: prepilin-type N-terminal cleavage/methylation domain-containing protein [Cyanobacteria bacterium REEB65]|nr:prepilin-type N-terminal cleavage/methylation domain-containing protein [Cyanobacteria bacterium REEB65]
MIDQQGFTLIEVLIALLIVGAVVAASSRAYAYGMQTMTVLLEQETAWNDISSEENALRAQDFAMLRPKTVNLRLADLPGGQEQVQLRPIADLAAYEAQFEVRWGTGLKHRMAHSAVLSPFAQSQDDASQD